MHLAQSGHATRGPLILHDTEELFVVNSAVVFSHHRVPVPAVFSQETTMNSNPTPTQPGSKTQGEPCLNLTCQTTALTTLRDAAGEGERPAKALVPSLPSLHEPCSSGLASAVRYARTPAPSRAPHGERRSGGLILSLRRAVVVH